MLNYTSDNDGRIQLCSIEHNDKKFSEKAQKILKLETSLKNAIAEELSYEINKQVKLLPN